MSSAVIWIFIPLFFAAFLFLFQRNVRLVQVLGILVTIMLAFLAWQLPIGRQIELGPWPVLPRPVINPALTILGRQFILDNTSRSALIVIYLGTAIWFLGSAAIKISRLFIPLGLAIAAVLTASISVEPFIYAALLIEVAVILCVPILSPPGVPVSRGVLRFLIFQTIGMILLVISGWMVGQAQLNAIDAGLVFRATILLVLGFSMAMSAFPFSSWITLVAERANPFAVAFVFFTLPELVTLFAFSLFGRYNWLQQSPTINLFFSGIGILMILGGGLVSFFQDNLGRILGYAVITEIGIYLLTVGQILTSIQTNPVGDASLISSVPLAEFFFALLLPRGLTLALWALSLSILKAETKSLDFEAVRGTGHRLPLAVLGLGMANFSIAGYPLLAGYAVRSVLGISITQNNPLIAGLTLVGYFGLIAAAIRSLSILLKQEEGQSWKPTETRFQIFLVVVGCLILFIVGLYPQIMISGQNTLIP